MPLCTVWYKIPGQYWNTLCLIHIFGRTLRGGGVGRGRVEKNHGVFEVWSSVMDLRSMICLGGQED